MSDISLSGTLINLWCIVRENRSIFKITIGSGNDLDDLRKVIKEERKPRFNDFAPDELVLWRVNVASNILRNKETAIEPYLNEKLEDPADTVGNTFQNVVGNNIRVIVGVPVTGESCQFFFLLLLRVIFANNTEYLLILVLFFPASYRQTRPKNTFALS